MVSRTALFLCAFVGESLAMLLQRRSLEVLEKSCELYDVFDGEFVFALEGSEVLEGLEGFDACEVLEFAGWFRVGRDCWAVNLGAFAFDKFFVAEEELSIIDEEWFQLRLLLTPFVRFRQKIRAECIIFVLVLGDRPHCRERRCDVIDGVVVLVG